MEQNRIQLTHYCNSFTNFHQSKEKSKKQHAKNKFLLIVSSALTRKPQASKTPFNNGSPIQDKITQSALN